MRSRLGVGSGDPAYGGCGLAPLGAAAPDDPATRAMSVSPRAPFPTSVQFMELGSCGGGARRQLREMAAQLAAVMARVFPTRC
jgi:hypothetical protein